MPGLLAAELQNVDLDAHGQRSGQNRTSTDAAELFFQLSDAVAQQTRVGHMLLSFELLAKKR